jgi:hypothetical protein
MRQPKPWFRTSKNAWYIQYGGRKFRLGGHPEGAPRPDDPKAGGKIPRRFSTPSTS